MMRLLLFAVSVALGVGCSFSDKRGQIDSEVPTDAIKFQCYFDDATSTLTLELTNSSDETLLLHEIRAYHIRMSFYCEGQEIPYKQEAVPHYGNAPSLIELKERETISISIKLRVEPIGEGYKLRPDFLDISFYLTNRQIQKELSVKLTFDQSVEADSPYEIPNSGQLRKFRLFAHPKHCETVLPASIFD